jgi:hypothetical protein
MNFETPLLGQSIQKISGSRLEGCTRFGRVRATGKKAVVMDLSGLPTKSGANDRFSGIERFCHCRVPQLNIASGFLGVSMCIPDAAFDDRRRKAAIVKGECRNRKCQSANVHRAAFHAYLRERRRFVSRMRIQGAATGGTPDGTSRCMREQRDDPS